MMMIAAALTMLWGCSSSDDDDNNNSQDNHGGLYGVKVDKAPEWTFHASIPDGDIEGLPDWQAVDFYDYESSMTAIVFVSNLFGTELTEGDRMAAVIDGEVRDVRFPVPYRFYDEGETVLCFMLYIPFNPGEDKVELQYYCAQTNQTYIQKSQFSVKDDTVGNDEMFFFTLRPMIARYFVLPASLPFTPTDRDEMAVFIGDECCGIAEIQNLLKPDFIWLASAIDMKREGKKAYVRYYSADTQTIYETEPFLDLVSKMELNPPDTLKFRPAL